VPGLGQAVNGRWLLAAALAVPVVLSAALVAGIVTRVPPVQLAASIVDPGVLRMLMTVSLVVLAIRLVAVAHAFFDRRYTWVPTPGALGAFALVVGLTILPHAVAHWYAQAAEGAFAQFFVGERAVATGGRAAAAVAPTAEERLNVLVVGIDTRRGHDATLSDTMMLASIDPVLGNATLISIPRDLVDVPLGNGNVFGPKLNSLYGYAKRHPDEFPDGPMRALQDAVGALLDVRVQYYAEADFKGFIELVDAVGGVEVKVAKTLVDERYDGFGIGERGLRIEKGRQVLDGATALAYARVRHAVGESDFTRQHRQQEIVVALKRRLMEGGSLFTRLPALLQTLGRYVRTDLPPSLLPELAALADSARSADVTSVVIERPLVKGTSRARYGSVQVPRLKRIRAMTAALLPPPGHAPAAWPPDPETADATSTR
jgi:LCP family protein required for cell wall assembly